MEYTISDKMRSLKPSAIREIFKYAGDPSVISLAGGNPAPESLPVEDIQRIMGQVVSENPMGVLLYSQSEGHPPFREALKRFVRERYRSFQDFDELIVTTGAQQAMDLVCKVLCNEGDTVICEDPSFIGSLNTFRSYNVNLVGVPLEADGIDVAKLERALRQNPSTRFIYLIPNFQNPTGITMSSEKRKAVYALAKKYGVLILEDNPYGDLRFEGESVSTIKSLDTDGLVLYVGGFSKILSTGIRVAYLVAPAGLMGKIVVAKQCTDVHTSMPAQMLCYRFLEECDMDAHIEKIKGIYSHKCKLMLSEIAKTFPEGIAYTKPQGGIFVWVDTPGLDGVEFATRLVKERKVCVVPGSAFSVADGTLAQSFRMNFSANDDGRMVQGIQTTAELLREML